MQKNVRLTYFLFLALLISEVLHLSIDVGLFYAGEARAYFVSLGILFLKDVLACVTVGTIYLLIRRQIQSHAVPDSIAWVEPERAFKHGTIFLLAIVAFLGAYSSLFNPSDFNPVDEILAADPQTIYTVFKSHLAIFTFGAYLLALFIVAERLILFRRLKSTKSNFILMAAFLTLSSVAMIGSKKGDKLNALAISFLMLTGLMMLFNLFRLSWILPIKRDEKIRAIFHVPLIIGGIGIAMEGLNLDEHFMAYSFSVSIFLRGIALFGSLYLIVTLFSLLFYLPTSEAFERKSSEVKNLYAMSKFITDVFEEEKIYDSLVGYAREACGSSSSVWFDMYHPYSAETRHTESVTASKLPNLQWRDLNGEHGFFKTVAQQNISVEAIQRFSRKADFIWKQVAEKKSIVQIDDVENDVRFGAPPSAVKRFWRRMKSASTSSNGIGSIVSVPLLARNKLIGVLCVAKDVEYGFVKEDLELITTFADQAAVAIDNSRLIRELIDKERLQQELLVAQKIQLRLLPQSQPTLSGFQIDGVSYPAYEVGGDYFDYVQIGENNTKVGIIIADVSGKGTSAAFYMAELKGIVQSLARIYPNSPKEFLCKANETISRGLEKASFISALYGIIDTKQNLLQLSNAGHCPAVVVQGDKAKLVKMKGLALGLDKGSLFSQHASEAHIEMNVGDVVVLYTDGVIEAVDKHEEQFGYERLMEVARRSRKKNASEIKNDIFNAVNFFTNDGGAVRDDLTIVVLKRCAA